MIRLLMQRQLLRRGVPVSMKFGNATTKHIQRRSFTSSSGKAPAKSRGPVSWASLGVTLLTGAGIVYYYVSQKEKKKAQAIATNTKSIGKPKLGGQWTLVDQTGKPVTDASITSNGHSFALLYFGFTYCPDICPAELIKMKAIIDKLDKKIGPKVAPVFITCDPKRDGVAQVAHYIKDFHPRMVGLTGTPEQISAACRAFRVYHSIADQDEEDEDDYLVDHSIVMYLVGSDGMFLDFYTQLTEVDEAVERIEKIIAEEEANE